MKVINLDEEAIYHLARSLGSSEAREAYLRQVCGDDTALRDRLEALLRVCEQEASFLEISPYDATADAPVPIERPGTTIGPYKLMEQIGEGGMGVVYVAEQSHPVRRKVALKVIKPGMETKQVVARFEAERQALAMMDHPNIAKVHDGGTTESGRPYFVMELVRGLPLTEYCDGERLPIRQRLVLFVLVCRAVQHAHQKGIIHRDLKPSNILVTLHDGVPVPKIIDFGIAKAIGQSLTEKTVYTAFTQLVGTPLYMSPEQVELSGLDIDTRSDIYSLGVLLYELLTGTTPFDSEALRRAAFDEMRRIIREEEPPTPSTRLSTLGETLTTTSAKRGSDPRQLDRSVRGELDWITMKAMEKGRNRRYETANDFAADVTRYLTDLPVEACPPSARYRFHKFARRNKAALTTGALVVASLLVGAVVSTWQAVRATQAEAQANSNAANSRSNEQKALAAAAAERAAKQSEEAQRQRAESSERQVNARHLEVVRQVELALQEATTLQGEARWSGALAAVKRAEVLLEGREGSDPLLRRAQNLRQDLNMVSALEEIRLRATGERGGYAYGGHSLDDVADADYREAFRDYGIDLEVLDPPRAGALVRAQAICRELIAALDQWARLLATKKGKKETWVRLLHVARLADPDAWRNDVRSAVEHGDLATLKRLARADQAKSLPPLTLDMLAEALRRLGARPEAVALLSEAQRRYPDDFWINTDLAEMSDGPGGVRFYTAAVANRPQSPRAYINLGKRLMSLGLHDEALATFQEAVRVGPSDPIAHCNLGIGLWSKELCDEAAAEYREAIRLDPKYVAAHLNLGDVLRSKGLLGEAISYAREAIRLDKGFARAHHDLGLALLCQGQFDEAITSCREAIRLKKDYASAYTNLGSALRLKGQLDESLVSCREAIRLNKDSAPAYASLGSTLCANGKLDEAIASYREAIRLKKDYSEAHNGLGIVYAIKGQFDEAITCFGESIRFKKDNGSLHMNLGNALKSEGQLDEAIASYREAIRLKKDYAKAYITLGSALRLKGQLDEAIDSCREAIRLDNTRSWAHVALGWALRAEGRLDEAIACYRDAIQFDEKDPSAHVALGEALQAKGQLDEAIACYRESVRLNKISAGFQSTNLAITIEDNPVESHIRLGNALHAKGQLDEAVACYQDAMRCFQQPTRLNQDVDASAHRVVAWFLATCPEPRFRDVPRAVELAQKAVKLAPSEFLMWDTLGVCLYCAGDWKAAVIALEKSSHLGQRGGSPDRFFLAMTYWQLGDKDQARKTYDQAVQRMEETRPRDEELRRFRAEAVALLGMKDESRREK